MTASLYPHRSAGRAPDDEATTVPTMTGTGSARWHRHTATLPAVGAVYLLLGVLVMWQAWSTHPAGNTNCACGDSALFLWFLEWPAYAIAHGHNPLFSTAMFHPAGINLLANTSVLAVGIPLAPVTWLFGPVATLNVAETLSPALSALAAYALARRFVRWAPAAFVAGALYGFDPFVLSELDSSHLMDTVLVVPPLVALCLHELLVRQRWSPVVTGALLAVLATVQFFIGTEMLVILAITTTVGVLVTVVYAAVAARLELAARARHAVRGGVLAVVTSAAVLAYPAWYALDGPAHLSGAVWSIPAGEGGNPFSSFVVSTPIPAALMSLMHTVGGYQGPTAPDVAFLGIPFLVVLFLALLRWRTDRRLWFFTIVGLVTVGLGRGVTQGAWTPWRLFNRWPLLKNVIPGRFLPMTVLAAAMLLAVVVDRTRTDLVRLRAGDDAAPHLRGALAAAGALLVAIVAVGPIAWSERVNLPITTVPAAVPEWFRDVATTLPAGQVDLVFPAPWAIQQSSLAWQAIAAMPFDQVGGGGPESLPRRAGPERAAYVFLMALSLGPVPPPVSPGVLRTVRRALTGWGVTTVVLADQPGLPVYEQPHDPPGVSAVITAATGTAPVWQDDAWVWRRLRSAPPIVPIGPARLAACAAAARPTADAGGAARCVLAARPGP